MVQTIEQLAEKNPCIRFVLDNYDMLCLTHRDKTVLVVGERVMRVLPSLADAVMYTDAIDMKGIPFALIECNDCDPKERIVFSTVCRQS